MKEPPLSTAERNFLLQGLIENFRLDGREVGEFRPLHLQMGLASGSCLATLGNTKVFVQVSCELSEPKETRPNDGTLFVNVCMASMAAPQHEFGRSNDTGIELCRLLERIVKESQCVDTESLCVKSGELAWQIRLDVHVLDDDGALIDCASVCAIAALAHARRPDVTVTPHKVIVHSLEEREPVPLNMYHYPVCVSFGFIENGACMLVDPTDKERLVLSGCVVVGANKRKEICALHCTGTLALDKALILRVSARAIQRASDLSEQLQTTINQHKQQISSGTVPGLAAGVGAQKKHTYFSQSQARLDMSTVVQPQAMDTPMQASVESTPGPGTSVLRPDETVELSEDECEVIEQIQAASLRESKHKPNTQMHVPASPQPAQTQKSAKKAKRVKKGSDQISSLLGDVEQDVFMLTSSNTNNQSTKQEATVDHMDIKVDLLAAVKPKSRKKT